MMDTRTSRIAEGLREYTIVLKFERPDSRATLAVETHCRDVHGAGCLRYVASGAATARISCCAAIRIHMARSAGA